nr:hypothetical protein [Leptospira interrogans]
MIPCCSFDFIPQENWQFPVLMLGCSNGIEWHIKHERNAVTHTTLNGNSSTLALHEWISLVLTLTNQVEEFLSTVRAKENNIQRARGRVFPFLVRMESANRKSQAKSA